MFFHQQSGEIFIECICTNVLLTNQKAWFTFCLFSKLTADGVVRELSPESKLSAHCLSVRHTTLLSWFQQRSSKSPKYTTRSAPGSRRMKLETSWWTQRSIQPLKSEIFFLGGGAEQNRAKRRLNIVFFFHLWGSQRDRSKWMHRFSYIHLFVAACHNKNVARHILNF